MILLLLNLCISTSALHQKTSLTPCHKPWISSYANTIFLLHQACWEQRTKEMRITRAGCSARIRTKMQWLLLSALTSFESISRESWHTTSNVALVCMFTWIMQQPNIIIIIPSSECLQQPQETKSFLVVGWWAANTVDWRCSHRPYKSSCSVVSRTQISRTCCRRRLKTTTPLCHEQGKAIPR